MPAERRSGARDSVRRGRGLVGETLGFSHDSVSIGALHDPDGREVRFQGGKLA
jgi:hypothetical protein